MEFSSSTQIALPFYYCVLFFKWHFTVYHRIYLPQDSVLVVSALPGAGLIRHVHGKRASIQLIRLIGNATYVPALVNGFTARVAAMVLVLPGGERAASEYATGGEFGRFRQYSSKTVPERNKIDFASRSGIGGDEADSELLDSSEPRLRSEFGVPNGTPRAYFSGIGKRFFAWAMKVKRLWQDFMI